MFQGGKHHSSRYVENELEEAKVVAGGIGRKLTSDIGSLVCGKRGRNGKEQNQQDLMTVWMWSFGEGRRPGQGIVMNPGVRGCESTWSEASSGNKIKVVSFHLQWDGFASIKGLKIILQSNWIPTLFEGKKS